jgi:hypothetical protein
VPYRLLKSFRKIHPRLVRELEKKFSGKDVVFVANRRIMPVPKNGKASARPRSRTLTAVGRLRGAVGGVVWCCGKKKLADGKLGEGWLSKGCRAPAGSLSHSGRFGVPHGDCREALPLSGGWQPGAQGDLPVA